MRQFFSLLNVSLHENYRAERRKTWLFLLALLGGRFVVLCASGGNFLRFWINQIYPDGHRNTCRKFKLVTHDWFIVFSPQKWMTPLLMYSPMTPLFLSFKKTFAPPPHRPQFWPFIAFLGHFIFGPKLVDFFLGNFCIHLYSNVFANDAPGFYL